jgi:hypothetical protein
MAGEDPVREQLPQLHPAADLSAMLIDAHASRRHPVEPWFMGDTSARPGLIQILTPILPNVYIAVR